MAFDRLFRRSRSEDTGGAIATELAPGGSQDWSRGLPPKVEALIRACFVPETSAGSFENGSGFGGSPFLPRGIEHPLCPGCWQPMTLLLQLKLEDLPNYEADERGGLLQLFYCTTDEPDLCERSSKSWAPFSDGSVVRIVSAYGGTVSNVPARFPAIRITGWREEPDLPTWEEMRSIGVVPDPDLGLRLINADVPRLGDKLAGWPAWVQGVEYPSCPLCGATMRLVFQIASEVHVPFRFGDSGTGHITRCETHQNLVAFGWACA